MKKFLLIIALSIVSFSESYAQNNWQIKGGFNYSTFRNSSDVKPIYGYFIGIGREWSLKYNLSVAAEINFLTKGGIIKDKPIKPVYFAINQDVYLSNIKCYIGYLEFPLLIKYNLVFAPNTVFKMFLGPVYSIPYIDKSKIIKKKYLYTLEPNKYYDFEYHKDEESNLYIESRCIYNFGLEFKYRFFSFVFYYSLDNRTPISCDSVSEIHKKIDSYFSIVSFYF